MELQFGFKDLYDVILTANQETIINGEIFEEGDPIIFLMRFKLPQLIQ